MQIEIKECADVRQNKSNANENGLQPNECACDLKLSWWCLHDSCMEIIKTSKHTYDTHFTREKREGENMSEP